MCFKRSICTKPNVDLGKIKQAFFKIIINLKQILLFFMVVVFSFPLTVI